MEKKNPQLYIIAGPNGAGKTTFAKKFLPQYASCKNFINADLIADGLSPFFPRSAAIKAGKLLLGEIHNLAEKKLDFAFETTLSGKTHASFLREQKAKGYSIHLFFLWIPSVELASGGHDVEEGMSDDVFQEALVTFKNIEVTTWQVKMYYKLKQKKPLKKLSEK